MAEIIIPEMMQALKAVRQSNANDVHIRYDREADVMYVNIGAPGPADDSELGDDDILYRYANGKVIGFTITHFSKR
ncbi:DUF2283 domain-containing protein [Parafilimonas terrae]|jgi:uncharacterized protein YuzE|uniref:Uncharacterized protein YuzE n=1 Tax=Parafilimonas terrae TaxID=1465490 RepID=A0A1I5VAV8_9BACT|nr:DUF2283 domain-containing protein [Parafilimonas terrae]SFQ04477.1 Uncharacterized protein YuzE [Parafilimonas terrae]